MASNCGLYAYGLVDKSPEHLDIVGIDQHNKVFPLPGNASYVMVSEIDIDAFQQQVKQQLSALTDTPEDIQQASAALLQAHEDVVDTLMHSATVVPFQFGTVLKDRAAVSKMLQQNEEQFKNLLVKFAARAEWGLKVYADQQAFSQYTMHLKPELQKLSTQHEGLSKGVAYLLGRKMEEELKENALARLSEICEAIFLELGAIAHEAKLNRPQKLTGKKKEMIINSVYLVENASSATFCQHGTHLMEHYSSMGLELELSGPWPPYSFIA
jgi:hypothetical protein